MSSKEEDAEYEKYKRRMSPIEPEPKSLWLKRRRETEAKSKIEAKTQVDYEALSIPEKIAFQEKEIAIKQEFIDNLIKKAEERGKYNNLEPELIKKFQTDINLLKSEIRKLKPAKSVKRKAWNPSQKPRMTINLFLKEFCQYL